MTNHSSITLYDGNEREFDTIRLDTECDVRGVRLAIYRMLKDKLHLEKCQCCHTLKDKATIIDTGGPISRICPKCDDIATKLSRSMGG